MEISAPLRAAKRGNSGSTILLAASRSNEMGPAKSQDLINSRRRAANAPASQAASESDVASQDAGISGADSVMDEGSQTGIRPAPIAASISRREEASAYR